MRIPGVQKPHCSACASRKAACRGWRSAPPPGVRPSTVVSSTPSACTASIRQERTGSPSSSTVQAPHTPCSQPTCVPLSPRSWRRKSLTRSRGSTSRWYWTPLTVTPIVTCGHPRKNEGPTLSPAPRGGKTKRLLHSPSMHRREGLAKLTGRERYVDDLPLQDFLWGATVRSPVPRGRVTAVRFGKGVDWSQFVVVDAQDLPGPNEILLIERDQPVLAAGYVRHRHQAGLVLAHRGRVGRRRAAPAVSG